MDRAGAGRGGDRADQAGQRRRRRRPAPSHGDRDRRRVRRGDRARPVDVPVWLAASGPRVTAAARDLAVPGVLATGLPDRTWPECALLRFGTVLRPGEDHATPRVIDAAGPGWAGIVHAAGPALLDPGWTGTPTRLRELAAQAAAVGVTEVVYVPTWPDVTAELTAYAEALSPVPAEPRDTTARKRMAVD